MPVTTVWDLSESWKSPITGIKGALNPRIVYPATLNPYLLQNISRSDIFCIDHFGDKFFNYTKLQFIGPPGSF